MKQIYCILILLTICSFSCENAAERERRLEREKQQRIRLEKERLEKEKELAFQKEQQRIAEEKRLEEERISCSHCCAMFSI
jgi:hypothetical protein